MEPHPERSYARTWAALQSAGCACRPAFSACRQALKHHYPGLPPPLLARASLQSLLPAVGGQSQALQASSAGLPQQVMDAQDCESWPAGLAQMAAARPCGPLCRPARRPAAFISARRPTNVGLQACARWTQPSPAGFLRRPSCRPAAFVSARRPTKVGLQAHRPTNVGLQGCSRWLHPGPAAPLYAFQRACSPCLRTQAYSRWPAGLAQMAAAKPCRPLLQPCHLHQCAQACRCWPAGAGLLQVAPARPWRAASQACLQTCCLISARRPAGLLQTAAASH